MGGARRHHRGQPHHDLVLTARNVTTQDRVPRVEGERRSEHLAGRRSALLMLLPVLDTLERALATGSSDVPFYTGVVATCRQFTEALIEAGAEPFDSMGTTFDPVIHEAVDLMPRDDVVSGTVIGQVRRGWRLDGTLLRPARVVVAANADDMN
jgi:molecular chaperone GrpE